jgi:multidrug efflux pump subunit AcrA (membrane-fusion protein)
VKRKTWLAAAAVLVAVTVVVISSADQAAPAAPKAPVSTAKVQRGELSAMVSLNGTLTYRARTDGSPYVAINQARGIYTKLPAVGDEVGCGDVLYRVDDDPVLLLCGTVPAYRDLRIGDKGKDVRQLNRNLHLADSNRFTPRTEKALERLQHERELDLGDAVFLPKPVRISKVTGELGGSARPGAPVAQATSDTLQVQAQLEASQQGEVKTGDRVQITLPGNTSVKGKVDRLGRVAQTAGKDDAGDATIPAFIGLDDPEKAHGLDRAPVQVDITTKGVENALSVPATALVGRSGGGFAVEVVRRGLVAVKLGLFDTAGGRVQVEGSLDEGDQVVVPSQ